MNPRDDEWTSTRDNDYGDIPDPEREREERFAGRGPMDQARDKEGAEGPMEQARDRQGPYAPMEQAEDEYQRERGGPGEEAWRSTEHDVERDERRANQSYDRDRDLDRMERDDDLDAPYDL
jgi:hypothetical protein